MPDQKITPFLWFITRRKRRAVLTSRSSRTSKILQISRYR